MALFAKDSQEILKESIDFMKENTAITASSPGSKFRSLIEIMKTHMGEAYQTFDFNTAVGLIHGSTGKYLDYLADIFGIVRMSPSTASVDTSSEIVKFYVKTGTFGDINGAVNITVPQGTRVWAVKNSDKIEFAVSSAVTLSAENSEQYVPIRAVSVGESYNTGASTIANHSLTNFPSLMVINTDSIENGSDIETDENLRYRIINKKLVDAAGNHTAIKMAALSVSGVADAEVYDRHYGIGTVAVMVKTVTPVASAAVVTKVQSAIDDVKGKGIKAIAMAPDYMPMEFVLTINFKDGTSSINKASAKDLIISTVSDYVNNLDIGEAFVANDLAAIIIQTHSSIRSIGKVNKFFDNIYVNKPIVNKYVKAEVISDYTPRSYQKLIISTESNGITIK